MQMRKSSIRGDRPECPIDRGHKVHAHGNYTRYKNADGTEQERVPRWLCIVCCKTISVLPDEMLPYRSVGTYLAEKWLDAVFLSRAPPITTENEKGCLKRLATRFVQRIPVLREAFGQMISATRPSASKFWKEIRKSMKLEEILRLLAEKFKTSLLADYLCLSPWVMSR